VPVVVPRAVSAVFADDLVVELVLLRDGRAEVRRDDDRVDALDVAPHVVRGWLRALEPQLSRAPRADGAGLELSAHPHLGRAVVARRAPAPLALDADEVELLLAPGLGGLRPSVVVVAAERARRHAALAALVAARAPRAFVAHVDDAPPILSAAPRVADPAALDGLTAAGVGLVVADAPSPAFACALVRSDAEVYVGVAARDPRAAVLRLAALVAEGAGGGEARAALEVRAAFSRVFVVDPTPLRLELTPTGELVSSTAAGLLGRAGLDARRRPSDGPDPLLERPSLSPRGVSVLRGSVPALHGHVPRERLAELTPEQLLSQSFLAERPADFGAPTAAFDSLSPEMTLGVEEAFGAERTGQVVPSLEDVGFDDERGQNTAHGVLAASPEAREAFTATLADDALDAPAEPPRRADTRGRRR
jgi:hypothetical protein